VEILIGNINKLNVKMISRHDILSRKRNNVKGFTKWALSPPDKIVETLIIMRRMM